jgi:hypothetical protein
MDTLASRRGRFRRLCATFSSGNPDWPGLPYLRAQGEPSLPRGGDADRVIAYFGGQRRAPGSARWRWPMRI